MRFMSIAGVSLLLCASVTGYNMTNDLESYLTMLWNARKNSLVGSFLPTFAPKLDLKKIIELFRGQMTKPFRPLGLPTLEPLQIDLIPLDVDHEIGRYEGSLKNLTVLHLSHFQVEELVLNLADLKADFNLSFSRVHLTGMYEFEGAFARMMDTWGQGNLHLHVHDMMVFGSLQVGTDQENVYMQSFNMDFSIHQVKGEIQGLHGGGELGQVLSEVVLEAAPMLTDMVRPQLSPWLSKLFLEQSNRRFNDLAIKKADVVDWLRQMATDKILSFTRQIKRDLSSACSFSNSFFTAPNC